MVKRFYKDANVAPAGGGFAVLLDGKPMKTPQRASVVVPTQALADAMAQEWRRQGTDIAPQTMKLTKLAYAAIDSTAQRDRVAGEVLGYARSDLLCYRAEGPDDFVIRQTRQWGPLLDWLAETYGARLRTVTGIGYVEQPEEALARLAGRIGRFGPFALVGLHAATAIMGSLALGLALAEGRLAAGEAFALSQLDETFQAEKWGRDGEAEARAANLRADLEAAEQFICLSQ